MVASIISYYTSLKRGVGRKEKIYLLYRTNFLHKAYNLLTKGFLFFRKWSIFTVSRTLTVIGFTLVQLKLDLCSLAFIWRTRINTTNALIRGHFLIVVTSPSSLILNPLGTLLVSIYLVGLVALDSMFGEISYVRFAIFMPMIVGKLLSTLFIHVWGMRKFV